MFGPAPEFCYPSIVRIAAVAVGYAGLAITEYAAPESLSRALGVPGVVQRPGRLILTTVTPFTVGGGGRILYLPGHPEFVKGELQCLSCQ